MVESPCIKLCRIDPDSALCLGCWRSLDEIAAWGGMSPDARRAVMRQLPDRRSAHDSGKDQGPTNRAGPAL